MKKVIIGIGIVLLLAITVASASALLHNKNNPAESAESVTGGNVSVYVEVKESIVNELPAEDDSVRVAMQSVVDTVTQNEVLSAYFTMDDIKVKTRDGDVVIYLDGCTRTGYDKDQLDMFIISVTGESYDCDDVLGLIHWLTSINEDIPVQSDLNTEPWVSASKADLYNEGDWTMEGWEKIPLDLFDNIEEWSTFTEADYKEYYNQDFLDFVQQKTGSYDCLLQLSNFLNIDAPYLGDKWLTSIDDASGDVWLGTISTVSGGVPKVYKFILNPHTNELSVFEEE